MIILGIKCTGHDTGAAILTEVGGRLKTFAIAEARLNRSKNSARFPLNAIDYCLRAAGVASLDDVDLIARDQLYDNWPEPMSQVGRELARQNTTIGTRTPARETYLLEHSFKAPHSKIQIVNHIDAHAASCYYLSGFEESAVLTMEGGTGIHHGRGLALRPIDRLGYGADVFHNGECIEHGETSFKSSNFTNTAILYDTVTERMGYDHLQAGKTMALAAFAKQIGRKRILDIPRGRYLDFIVLYGAVCDHIKKTVPVFKARESSAGALGVLNELYVNLAADAQEALEEDMVYLAELARAKTGSDRLCLAGGNALSCVGNRRVFDTGRFAGMFIQPAASDEGIPLGAVLWSYYQSGGRLRERMDNAYFGAPNDPAQLVQLLNRHGLEHARVGNDQVAALLADGKIVARMFGGSEYGPRALGNRSILADPRRLDMKDRVNREVKHRESYRPFAPSCVFEKRADYFDLPMEAPFMIMAAPVLDSIRDVIPAVTHVDGSSRPQTVRREQNPDYYDLIEAFGRRTGVYVLLNTSFNDDGEPIVETYQDGLISFLRTGIDYLYADGYLIPRPKEPTALLAKLVAERDAALAEAAQHSLEKHFDTGKYQQLEAALKAEAGAKAPSALRAVST